MLIGMLSKKICELYCLLSVLRSTKGQQVLSKGGKHSVSSFVCPSFRINFKVELRFYQGVNNEKLTLLRF